METLELEQNLSQLLLRTVELPDKFKDCPQIFVLQGEDIHFVKNELGNTANDLDTRLDTLLKLYIAFYLDSIPVQVVENLRKFPDRFKQGDLIKEYLISVAGILHESKTILEHNNELMIPYLMAYKEYLGAKDVEEIAEDDLINSFKDVIESAIQALINF